MATMESLISLVNRIQRACTVLGDHGAADSALPTLWEALPSVAVVGGQSSGKSSVLESIVGRDFLPRGSGIVTRRPLVLQLHKTEDGQTEYAEFLHLPKKIFTDFSLVRKEIADDTDRLTGRSKQISPIPIQLSIYSPKVVNLTLIDLPGLTKIAVEGQPDSIVQDIENMVRSYVEKAAMIVMSARFWANVELAVGIFTPFVKVLRRVDGDTPSMGWLYGDIKKAKEEVAAVLDHQENKYLPIWKLIDSRWEKKMSSPLHLAGYYLNPYFYYSHRVELEADGRFMSGFVECLSRIYRKDPSTQDHISVELDLYQYQQGLFGKDMTKRQLQNPNLNPVHWWRLNGADTPHLKTMAMKILSLTTSSSGCERNWSTFEMPNSIILAISPANQDIATSDAIKLAREVDPSGERTFGVLTKLDLMDKGTDALDVLEGRSYKLQHPWVGIVNRSQADINKNVDMIAARHKEREYFATSPEYSHLSSKMGSEYLAKLLSKHLESVIRVKIPSITSLINKTIEELESEMDHLGRPIGVDAGAQLYTILELCRAFEKIFKEHLDGGRPGGDRIYGVFDNQLPTALKKLPFDRHLSLQNVRKVVSEADGYQPHLIAPEQGYRRLIEGALNYFRGPAEASVDAVHLVLKELVRKSIGETQELNRFPTLQSELAASCYQSLERFREDGKKTAIRLVDMEASYLTVEFFRNLPQEVEKGGNTATPTVDRYTEGHFRRIASNVSSYIGMVSETLRLSIPKAAVHCQVREAKRSLLSLFYTQVGRKEAKQLGLLLDEDPALMERRVQCAKRLELYKSARDEIDAVSWAR